MNKEIALNELNKAIEWIKLNKIFSIKIAFLVAMMLIGHHRGLLHIWPIKIPIAHGLNQILGAIVWLAIGVVILALTSRLLGW